MSVKKSPMMAKVDDLHNKHEADNIKFTVFCAVVCSIAFITALANSLKCIVCS